MEKAEAEKLQVVMAAQGDAEAKYLQGQARRHVSFFFLPLAACAAIVVRPLLPDRAAHLPMELGPGHAVRSAEMHEQARFTALHALPAGHFQNLNP